MFHLNGMQLNREDFPDTLHGWIAFMIVFTACTPCTDKDAILELLFD